MSMLIRIGTILRGLVALAVVLALVFGGPALLTMIVGNPVPDAWQRTHLLSAPVLLAALGLAGWFLWAQMTLCILVEVIAEIRIATGRSADWLSRVPGTFGGQQALARTLVHAIVMVGVTTSATTSATTVAANAATPLLNRAYAATIVASMHAHPTSPSTHVPEHAAEQAPTRQVTTVRGDTLWSIAEQHLGAGERWREIADLNEGRKMSDGTMFNDARTIRPGWTLLVPSPATTAQETAHTVTTHTVTVRAGDTLWGIAKRTYDDSKDWPRIYEANEADIDDPHWIYPGETLVIPAAPSDDTDHTGRPSGPGHRNDQQSPTESAEPAEPAKAVKSAEPSTTTSQVPSADPTKSTEPTKSTIVSSPASTASPTTAPATPKVDASESSGQGQTTIAIHALLGGGGLLAAGLLATYVARRRTQSRQRGVGRVGAKVPEELLAEARQIHLAGSSTGDAAQFLDEALRELAEMTERAGGRLPEVAAARIDEDRLLLRITPADTAWIDGPIPFVSPLPPAPWVVSRDGTEWSLSRSHLPARFDRVAPYPCLVTLGMDDVGGTWLLDLESAGVTEVSGDPERAIEVLRFIAAELAINSWSDVEMAGIYGIGEEVAAINPGRLMTEPQPRIDDLTRIARHAQEADESQDGVLRTRVVDGSRGAWMPVVLLAALDSGNASPGVEYAEEVRGFADALAGASGRSGAALVMVERAHSAWPDDETSPAQINLQVDERGRMHTPFGVLTANRMSADDAAALAGLLADADDLRDEAMPLATDSTDVAGAIATPTTTARYGTGDPDSLLPRADDDYLRVTATTAQDLAVMAPGVPVAATRDLPGDPELDADLAAWNDAASPRPKLHLLGPIRLEAAGERSADVEARPAYFAELAAYLACHPRGVTPDQVATAFGLQHNTLHTRINSLRRWLGKNATTGGWYLPDSTTTEARKARGQALYQLDGLLCDAELFRRLRTQGQARGPLGIDSLVTALGLVEGKPYDQPRKGGYAWLLESPEDQYLTAAVVDVAHIVATHALAEGDPALATWAAEIAIGAAPYEDRPRLDEAAAQKALGNVAEAERILNCDVFDRTDDDRPPLDPSPRTLEVASRISPDPRRRR